MLIAHRSEIINHHQHHSCCMCMTGMPKKYLAGVPAFVVQRQNSWRSCSASKSVALCSQVSSLCRTSLWNNSFTLAAVQYGHNQSCHQPTVQTQAGELYSYENHRDPFRIPMLNTQVLSVQETLSFVPASTAFRRKAETIC